MKQKSKAGEALWNFLEDDAEMAEAGRTPDRKKDRSLLFIETGRDNFQDLWCAVPESELKFLVGFFMYKFLCTVCARKIMQTAPYPTFFCYATFSR